MSGGDCRDGRQPWPRPRPWRKRLMEEPECIAMGKRYAPVYAEYE